MAPTICSGKKRQTRTIATTEIRRHGQRSQLNQALSNIVNYVAKGSINPRAAASLRIHSQNQTEKNTTGSQQHHLQRQHSTNHQHHEASTNTNSYNHSTQTSATLAANHRRQQFSFLSDNAVTSSTHSDTENSYDMRMAANGALGNNDSYGSSSSINPSSSSLSLTLSSLTSSSQKESTETSRCEERRFQRYSSSSAATTSSSSAVAATSASSSKVQANDFGNGNDVTDRLYENNDSALNTEAANNNNNNNKHSKHFFKYSDDDDEDDNDDDSISVDSMYAGSDTDGMDTDSMTSLDTEKSAELKRGNQPLWRDKYCNNNNSSNNINNNTKSLANPSNTEGLLSIAIKTIKLVKRNQLLQQRLTQLQLETSEFVESVLANPENRHFRENIKQKVQEVENV